MLQTGEGIFLSKIFLVNFHAELLDLRTVFRADSDGHTEEQGKNAACFGFFLFLLFFRGLFVMITVGNGLSVFHGGLQIGIAETLLKFFLFLCVIPGRLSRHSLIHSEKLAHISSGHHRRVIFFLKASCVLAHNGLHLVLAVRPIVGGTFRTDAVVGIVIEVGLTSSALHKPSPLSSGFF